MRWGFAEILVTLVLGLAWAGPVAAEGLDRETEAVRRHVADELSIPVEDVEIQYLGLAEPFDCEPEAVFSVDSSAREDFVGNADVRITAHEGTTLCGQARVRVRVRAWRVVAVAESMVTASEEVSLVTERVPIDRIHGTPVEFDSGPWEARIDIEAGEPVVRGAVRLVPANRSGESVLIVAGTGALRVTANGRLLQTARVGDVVRVSNLVTDQVVEGVLIEPGVVRAGGEV